MDRRGRLLLAFLVGAVSAALVGAASPPITASASPVGVNITTCLAARADAPHISLSDARSCAPGGQYLKTSHGYVVVTSGTTGAVAHITSASASTWCAFRYGTLNDAGVADWEGANFCWNGSSAWYNGGVQGSCSAGLGAACQGRTGPYAGNGSWSTEAWAQYNWYQSCGWVFNCSDAFQVRVNRNGVVRYVTWGI